MENEKSNKNSLEESVDLALTGLESLADEIRVKLHLGGMDANVLWKEKLEPRLLQAREHSREARTEAKAAIEDTLKAFKDFAASL